MPTYDRALPKLNQRKNGRGRPAKRSKEVEKIILDAVTDGAPFIVACSLAGVSSESFMDWRRRDAEFNDTVEKAVAACTLRRVRKIERHGEETFAALAWLLERRHPELFGRPEIQLNMIAQTNTVENSLTINISSGEAMEVERQARPIRDAVGEMFEKYRPIGNGEAGVRDVEASSMPEPEKETPPISHRDTDAQNPGFWHALVSSDPERKVAKSTAIFAVRAILVQLQGFKGHRAQIDFAEEPTTVGDLFDRLERLCGAPGWGLAQKLGGY